RAPPPREPRAPPRCHDPDRPARRAPGGRGDRHREVDRPRRAVTGPDVRGDEGHPAPGSPRGGVPPVRREPVGLTDGSAEDRDHRPSTDYGEAGILSEFRGPFRDGPPPEALVVETPPLETFGFAELRRMVLTYVVLFGSVVLSVLRWVVKREGRTLARAAADGAVDGFIRLGPTF